MKRTFQLTAAVAAVAILAAMPLMAQGPQGRPGRGAGIGMGMGPGGPGGPGGRGGGPMGILRGLELTEAQREQIRAIHQQARENDPPQQKMMDLQKQLQLAILADAPDASRIDGLKSAIAAAEAEMLARRIDVETRIVQVLTAEQRAKARANVGKAQPGPRGGRGEAGFGRFLR